ncbi:hypothetical protein M758_9G188800 [Ceratodon purpureus]|nr:hypothetical protein M758_9G188800 [Ceratodon purpureus]
MSMHACMHARTLTRAPSRLVALLMLAMVSPAVFYVGLDAHARAWWNKPTHEGDDLIILENFQQEFVQCVREKAMDLDARPVNACKVKLIFTDESAAMWRDPKTGELEGLVYEFDLCRMITLWEQVRNSTTILTRDFIDGLPNGWRDYAWKRINKGHSKMCFNATWCKEKLALVLPRTPPLIPRQHGRCAVVGNSGDLLQDLFGAEIDAYDAVIRMNGASVQKYTHYVGEKTTFRILNRGTAKALDKVAALAGKETQRDFPEVPIRNPVYLMVGAPLGRSAKGTGIKAVEFALSVCEQVDIYGFTVDPGYLEWSRYFSDARKGHAPLQGRAYYQTMECLGVMFNRYLLSQIRFCCRSEETRFLNTISQQPSRKSHLKWIKEQLVVNSTKHSPLDTVHQRDIKLSSYGYGAKENDLMRPKLAY